MTSEQETFLAVPRDTIAGFYRVLPRFSHLADEDAELYAGMAFIHGAAYWNDNGIDAPEDDFRDWIAVELLRAAQGEYYRYETFLCAVQRGLACIRQLTRLCHTSGCPACGEYMRIAPPPGWRDGEYDGVVNGTCPCGRCSRAFYLNARNPDYVEVTP